MKRFLCLLLATLLLLSLAACGEDTPATNPTSTNSTTPDTTESVPGTEAPEPTVTEPNEPTAAEMKAIQEYARIVVTLKEYLTNGYIVYSIYDADGNVQRTLNGQEALDYCYQQLLAMESLDRWLGTEFSKDIQWHDTTPSWDRMAAVGGFKVLSGYKLRQDYVLTKKGGSTQTGTESSWTYDQNGVLLSVDGIRDMFETVQTLPVFPGNFTVDFEFGSDGKWSKLLYGNYATGTPTYDASGKITGIAVSSRDDSCVVNYTYSGSLLTKIAWTEYNMPVEIEYTYDGNGNVIQSVYTKYTGTDNLGSNLYPHQRITFAYTYNGTQLVSATRTEEISSWDWDANMNFVFFVSLQTVDSYKFAYETGRLVSVDITYGDTYYMYGSAAGTSCRTPEYQSKHIDIVYGNYYFYTN